MNYFSIHTTGETIRGYTHKQVSDNLETKFSSKQELNRIDFNANTKISITDLDYFTASQYLGFFNEAGAKANIRLEADELPETYPGNDCPKCGSISTRLDQCLDCNVFISKFWNALKRKYVKEPIQEEYFEPENQEDNLHIRRWFKRTAILISSAFIIDNTLQESALMYFLLKMDLGLWPYLPGYLSLIYSVYLMTRALGYSGIANWLGAGFLPGLSLSLLLPKKGEPFKLFDKKPITALMIFVFSIYWVMGQQANVIIPMEKSNLADGREVYPSNSIQTQDEIFIAEAEEVTQHVAEIIDYISSNNLRRNNIDNRLDLAFFAMEEYMAWWEYQRFLNFQNKNYDSPVFTYRWKSNLISSWITLVHDAFGQTNDPKLINKLTNGFNGDHSRSEDLNYELEHFHESYRKVISDYHSKVYLPRIDGPLSFKDLKLKNRNLKLTINEPYFTISANHGQLNKTPLVYVIYSKETIKGDKKHYEYFLKRVDNGYPDNQIVLSYAKLLSETFHIRMLF